MLERFRMNRKSELFDLFETFEMNGLLNFVEELENKKIVCSEKKLHLNGARKRSLRRRSVESNSNKNFLTQEEKLMMVIRKSFDHLRKISLGLLDHRKGNSKTTKVKRSSYGQLYEMLEYKGVNIKSEGDSMSENRLKKTCSNDLGSYSHKGSKKHERKQPSILKLDDNTEIAQKIKLRRSSQTLNMSLNFLEYKKDFAIDNKNLCNR